MFCKHCGKSIEDGSFFCEFCGGKISDNKAPIRTSESEPAEQKTDLTIWDKFTDIYDSRGEERELYINMTSNEAWEAIDKLPVNSYEDFLKENKSDLNRQPYKSIEAIEQAFKGALLIGYWIWLAETLFEKSSINKPQNLEYASLLKEWVDIVQKEQPAFIKNIKNDLATPFVNMSEHRMKTMFESAPSLKELPVKFIENLKLSLLIQMIWGYMLGVAENKYRNKPKS